MAFQRPILIFDGDCGFCRRWISVWSRQTGEGVEYLTSQDFLRLPQAVSASLQPEDFSRSVILLLGGQVYKGAEAVLRSLAPSVGWVRGVLWCYEHVPGVRQVFEFAYRSVAEHRMVFSRLTTLLWGEDLRPSTYLLSRWVFLRALGLVYFFAFASLCSQMAGLVGQQGIQPAHLPFGFMPNLWGVSDFWVRGIPLVGAGLSLLLLLGVTPAVLLCAGLWGLYWACSVLGGQFLGFQWDSLMLEMGFLAILFAPWSTRTRVEVKPSPWVLFLFRWLLFRVIFMSGYVKWASGDLTWRNFTALSYHFETQPLPTWLGWYLHQLPPAGHQLLTGLVFVLELGVPWFIFAPRRPRAWACVLLFLFQLGLSFSGNYGFFGWQVSALCLLLMDDAFFQSFLPSSWGIRVLESAAQWQRLKGAGLRWVVCLLCVSSVFWVPGVSHWVSRLRIVNSYGVFAEMSQLRDEIVLEGSRDGQEWVEYSTKYKPSDVRHAPAFLGPYMPRLDWQFWFAALGDLETTPWVTQLMIRILEGGAPIVSQFELSTLGQQPPLFIRAIRYEYHFTDWATRAQTGRWWSRQRVGSFSPILTNQVEQAPSE